MGGERLPPLARGLGHLGEARRLAALHRRLGLHLGAHLVAHVVEGALRRLVGVGAQRWGSGRGWDWGLGAGRGFRYAGVGSGWGLAGGFL